MLKISILGIKLCFDFSFFAVLGLFLAFDDSGYGRLCFEASVCHEIGHLAAMAISEIKPKEIIFSGGGICIKQSGEPSAFVLAAGCLTNFLLFFIFIFEKGDIFNTIFAVANLFTGFFNLLPLGGLDGKRLSEKALIRVLGFEKAEKIILKTGIFFTLLLILGTIFLIMSKKINPIGIFVIIYIFALDFTMRSL